MAQLATQQIAIGGMAPAYAAAGAGGDKVEPGNHALHVKNGSGASVTVTIVTPGTVQGQAIGDVAVAVPAGADRFIGPFPSPDFAGSDGLVSVTYSAVASVTVAVLRIA